MITTNLPRYFSPKRKREPSESDYYSPSASPTSTVSVASLQEALIREENPRYPENTVIEVLREGYLYKDRLLRPAPGANIA